MFTFIELSSIAIFAYYLRDSLKSKQLDLLFYAAIFAFLFENTSIMLFVGQAGGYYYNSDFNLFVHHTPLFIILLWTSIIYSTYGIVGKLASRPSFYFLAPLYILLLDIVLDQMATKFELWTWLGFENYTGLFSVPASNYIGWAMLPFFFFVAWDKLKDKKIRVLQPFLAYLAFIIFASPLHLLKTRFFDDNLLVQYLILAGIVVVLALLSIRYYKMSEKDHKKNPAIFIVRLYLHLFSLAGIAYYGYLDDLYLVAVFALIVVSELWIYNKYMKLN